MIEKRELYKERSIIEWTNRECVCVAAKYDCGGFAVVLSLSLYIIILNAQQYNDCSFSLFSALVYNDFLLLFFSYYVNESWIAVKRFFSFVTNYS